MTAASHRIKAAHGQRGQVIPLIAISLTVLMGFASLAVDAGYMRYEQRIQQSATDSAALAAANELAFSSGAISTAATTDVEKNGFTPDGTSIILTVTWTPATGAYAGDNSAVDVTLKVKHPAFFAGIFGANDDVTTEAVGLLNPHAGPDCLYVLEDTSHTPINGSQVNMPTCGMIFNGALTVNGASVDAQTIGVAGSITTNGATYAESTPAPAVQATDPCPMIAGCNYLQNNPPATSPCNYTNFRTNGGTDAYLSPGVYCGNTTFNGTTNINFNSGLYVFTGDITSNGITNYNGTGVTIVMTGGSSNTVTFNGSNVNLQAPTSGNYTGMVFYAPNLGTATVNGGPGTMGGVLYFPKAQLTYNGTSSSYYVVVSGKLTINGGISDSGPGAGGGFIGKAVLAQ